MTHASSDNLYGPATYIVDASAAKGSHTTIASAIAAASSGDTIFIRPGTYTEDFTVKGGLTIFSAQSGVTDSQTKIVGKITHTEATETTWSNICFETNLDYLYSVTGSNSVRLTYRNCTFIYSDNDALEFNNSNAIIEMYYCTVIQTANSLKFFTITAVSAFQMFYCYHRMSGITLLTASTIAAGVFRSYFCEFDSISFAASGTSNFQARKSMFFTSNENVTIITTSGTGGNHQAYDCTFSSGSAIAISIGSGTIFQFKGSCNVESGNATPISGAGSIFSYDLITFSGGGATIGIAPTNPRYTALQRLSLNEGSDYMLENLIKSISPDTTDAAYLATVAATSWIWGIDNSVTSPTVDPWVLSRGTALGTNNVMSVATSGEINYPLQPSFLTTIGTPLSNVTGDGTLYTVVFSTEIYDQNSDLSGSTFTAPVTGRYLLKACLYTTGLTSSHTAGNIRIVTSNRSYIANYVSPYAASNSSAQYGFQISTIADMDAADTATVALQVSNGTKVVSISSVAVATYFTGNLLA